MKERGPIHLGQILRPIQKLPIEGRNIEALNSVDWIVAGKHATICSEDLDRLQHQIPRLRFPRCIRVIGPGTEEEHRQLQMHVRQFGYGS